MKDKKTSQPGARQKAGKPGKQFAKTAQPHKMNTVKQASRGGIIL